MLGDVFSFTFLVIIGGATMGQTGISSATFGVGVDASRRGKDGIDGANAPVVFSEGSIWRQGTLLCRINGNEVMATVIDLDRRDVVQVVRLGKGSGLRAAWWSGSR